MPLDSRREYFNPIEWLTARGADCSHITFDPSLRPLDAEYRIIRGCTHDGTVMFTEELIAKTLVRLVTRETYFRDTEPADWSKVRDIRYTVGLARRAVVLGKVNLPCGRFPGQRERIAVPVRCEYVTE